MSNLLFTGGSVVQGTTLGSIFGNQLVVGGVYQPSSQACIVDLTPPTFAGISFLSIGALGQLQAQWSAATDSSTPVSYEVYVKPATSVGLFNTVNIALVTRQLLTSIFALGNGTLLQTGVEYYVGVRAIDSVGNRDSNLVSVSQISPGITGAINASISGVFNIDDSNNLIASFWVNDSEGIVTNPLRLGTGSYVIYDKNGNLIPSMTESGIVPDAQGFFEITPVASVLDLDNNFYSARVTIPVDGVPVVFNLPIVHSAAGHEYEPRAVFSINASNQLQGTFWCLQDGVVYTQSLGTASYTIYDKDGLPIGISQSGITADANGYFKTAPVSASSILDLTHYVVKISISAAGDTRTGAVGITLGE